jgi:hypothetical protein
MKTGVQKIRHFQKLELNTPWQKFDLVLCVDTVVTYQFMCRYIPVYV